MGKDKANRGGACASSSRAAAGGFGGNVFAGYDRGRHRLVVIFLVSFRTMTTSPISFSSFRPTTMSLPGPGLEFGTDLTFSRHTKHTSRAASERPRYPGCRHRDTPCLLTNVISPSDIFSISSHSTSKKTKKKTQRRFRRVQRRHRFERNQFGRDTKRPRRRTRSGYCQPATHDQQAKPNHEAQGFAGFGARFARRRRRYRRRRIGALQKVARGNCGFFPAGTRFWLSQIRRHTV